MATSLLMRDMLFGDGVPDPAQDLRLGISGQMTSLGTAGSTGLASRGGVRRTSVGTPLAVAAGSGMSVVVAVGQCHVPASSGDSGGLYQLTLDTGGSLTVAAADPSNPRIDLVVAQANDVGSISSTATVNIITGTPASVPAVPATPAGALALASVLVPAGSTSVSSGNISDLRQWTVALGGILCVAGPSAYPATGVAGDYLHDLSSGRIMRWTGTGWGVMQIAPFASTEIATTTPVNSTSSTTKQLVVTAPTVTTDGTAKVKLTASWSHVSATTAAVGDSTVISIWRDTTQIKQCLAVCAQTVHSPIDGGSLATFDTPAAGTHTYRVYMLNTQSGDTFQMFAGAGAPIELMVEAALA